MPLMNRHRNKDSTMQSYILTGETNPTVTLIDAPEPVAGPNELLIEVKAASLNYRDLIVSKDGKGGIPLSDGAGVVVKVGEGTSGFKVGDRVVIGFMPGWVDGEFTAAKQATSLGGVGVNGVLCER